MMSFRRDSTHVVPRRSVPTVVRQRKGTQAQANRHVCGKHDTAVAALT
jgi:hypothetical protein